MDTADGPVDAYNALIHSVPRIHRDIGIVDGRNPETLVLKLTLTLDTWRGGTS